MPINNPSAKTVWGKIVLYLKEHKEIALHVACGDITDVQIDGGKLIINTFEGTLVSLLEEGKKEIERALRWQGLELDVEIKIKQLEVENAAKDIEKLKEVFDDVSIVKRKNKMIWR